MYCFSGLQYRQNGVGCRAWHHRCPGVEQEPAAPRSACGDSHASADREGQDSSPPGSSPGAGVHRAGPGLEARWRGSTDTFSDVKAKAPYNTREQTAHCSKKT